jgi:pimeloyl-ACP methyl ester carboxylesterase
VADYLHAGVSGPVVLVGHSYGGAVITNAAVGDPNVRALVYVDAFIPKQGQTLLELTSAQPGSCLGGEPTDAFNFVPFFGAPAGDFDAYMKQEADGSYPGFANCFANTLPFWKAEELWADQRPLALNALFEPSGPPAWKTIPCWDVIGTEDHLIPPAEQTIMAKEADAATIYVRAPHVSMVARPEVVARVIAHAASATS